MVQIYHPEKISGILGGRITQYGNLSYINPRIRFTTKGSTKADLPLKVKEYYKKHPSKTAYVDIDFILKEQERLTEQFLWTAVCYGFVSDKDPLKNESFFLTFKEGELLYKSGDPLIAWVEQEEVIGEVGNSL